MRYLADTNILSELARANSDPGVVAWAQTVSVISLSVVKRGRDIFFGLTWKPNRRVEAWFDEFLKGYCEICPVTANIARRAGELRGILAARGQTRTQADMLIAATAQAKQQTLVTRICRTSRVVESSSSIPFRKPLVEPWGSGRRVRRLDSARARWPRTAPSCLRSPPSFPPPPPPLLPSQAPQAAAPCRLRAGRA